MTENDSEKIQLEVTLKGATSKFIPFTLGNLTVSLDYELERALKGALSRIGYNKTTPTLPNPITVPCRGPEGNLEGITAIVSVGETFSKQVRCPRLKLSVSYLEGDDQFYDFNGFCYCGDEREVPVVERKEFSRHGIHLCPYLPRD